MEPDPIFDGAVNLSQSLMHKAFEAVRSSVLGQPGKPVERHPPAPSALSPLIGGFWIFIDRANVFGVS